MQFSSQAEPNSGAQQQQQAGKMRITPDEARSIGAAQRGAFGNPLFTGNSSMPVPKGQSPSHSGLLQLPRVRPSAALLDADTMAARKRAGR